jgi:hypothetical protein
MRILSDCVALPMPDPCGANDVVKLGVLGLPGKFSHCLFGAGDQNGWVAGAAGMNFYRDGVAGDAARGLDDFAYAEALSVT